MEGRSLQEIVAAAVDRVCAAAGGPLTVDEVMERIREDEDLKILLDGYRMHDRSEGLEDVILRDIRRMVESDLSQRQSG